MRVSRIAVSVVAALSLFGLASARAQSPLTFEERVKAQEAIERVYYRHRVWPKDNPAPKPPFEQMVPAPALQARVEGYLKQSAVLDQYWQRPLTGEQLQAEMDRMASQTKDPATLKELFAALDNDPRLIAECLARPALADRLARNWYACDRRFHGDLERKARRLQRALTPQTFAKCADGEYHEVKLVLGKREPSAGPDDPSALILSREEFAREAAKFPSAGGGIALEETNDAFILRRTVSMAQRGDTLEGAYLVFQKRSFDSWLSDATPQASIPESSEEFSFRLPESLPEGHFKPDSWASGDYCPTARIQFTAVWTGTEMIVWGGYPLTNTGGRYNPQTASWSPTSVGTNVPSARNCHVAVWTGVEMIVWGGGAAGSTGGRYNPLTDTWAATSTGANVPAGRSYATAVWSGTEMIVWGGSGPTNTGGRYNPQTDTWASTSTGTNVPSARQYHTAVWSGTEMIVWGGSPTTNTGGRYNPQTDTWLPTSTGTGVPAARHDHTAVWAGNVMVVWGGSPTTNTGGRYNPQTDSWTNTSTGANVPSARYFHTAVWTGVEMIVWGGGAYSGSDLYLEITGGRYNPQTDTWAATSTGSGVPTGRAYQTAVWTGVEMIVWGGATWDFGTHSWVDLKTGADYNPQTDSWAATATVVNLPSARFYHSAVWTGTEMIVWGGATLTDENTGGRYNPALDTWSSTSTGADVPSPRRGHSAVWTGTEMIVWGGEHSGYLNTGGRYDPQNDTWSATSTGDNVPTPRRYHSAVWTGTYMIIWGGLDSSGYSNTGGRYAPTSDSWLATNTADAPSARRQHAAFWAQSLSLMIVWGGVGPGAANTGGRYDPAGDRWTATSTGAGCPVSLGAAVWTGTEMIVCYGFYNPGGRYNPQTDTWVAIPSYAGIPWGKAVWTGSQMIVWGGAGDGSGARYSLASNSWAPTSTEAGCPPGVDNHTMVWTGNAMIVWGGENSSEQFYCYFTNTEPTSAPLVNGAKSATITTGSGTAVVRLSHELALGQLDDAEGYGASSPPWTAESPWHLVFAENCSHQSDYSSPTHAWRFGDSSTCGYEGSAGTYRLTSKTAIPLIPDARPVSEASPMLTFLYFLDTDLKMDLAQRGDSAKVEVSPDNGVTWVTVAQDLSHWVKASPPALQPLPMEDSCGSWHGLEVDLEDFIAVTSSTAILLRFSFTRDSLYNDRVGWIVDDIGVGSPVGDGSNPCLTPADSQGDSPQLGVPCHDAWDRAAFEWDLNGDGVADNTDTKTPLFTVLESDFARYKLNVPGDHTLTLKVTDTLGVSKSAGVTLHVLDGWPPTVSLIAPDGGESWAYSPDAASRRTHLIVWNASDNFPPLGRQKLSYSCDGGATWACVADTAGGGCASGSLAVGSTSFLWTMPTQDEAAAAGQTFPSASAKVKVEVWDSSGNYAWDASQSPFYIIQPTTTAVKTLILTNTARLDSLYPAPPGQGEAVFSKLTELANHDKVNGVVLELNNVPGLPALYQALDGDRTNVAKANAVADAIRDYVKSQVQSAFTSAKYLVLAGADLVIPSHRVPDSTATYPENQYWTSVDCSWPTGAAICANDYLTDARFGDVEEEATAVGAHFLALPDLATGRLVEQPQEIIDTVNTFIAQDGQVSLDPVKGKVYVTGYDFLEDSATEIESAFTSAAKTVDSRLGSGWSSDTLKADLFTSPVHALHNLNDHSDHWELGTPSGNLGTDVMDTYTGKPLEGTLFYNVGCHSGLSVPDCSYGGKHPLDLPQLMLRKGVAAYVGNTGFGWGLKSGVGYSERLMELITEELLSQHCVALGTAFGGAKRDYYLENHRYDVFDEKVLMESTLYGLPMYQVVVSPSMVREKRELHAEGPDDQEANGIRLHKSLRRAGAAGAPASGPTEVAVSFIFPDTDYSLHTTSDGSYYALNGMSNGEIGDTIQPLFNFDSRLSGTVNRGVLFAGGHFKTYGLPDGSFDPVVGVPQSNNAIMNEGPLPPGLKGAIGTVTRTSLPAGSSLRAEGGSLDLTRLTVYTGVFDGHGAVTTGKESLFYRMDFDMYYSNSADTTDPVITDQPALHTLSGLTANFSVQASDGSGTGVYRVVITYTDSLFQAEGDWQSLDLAYDSSTGRWEGSLDLKKGITYFAQAVDYAGNVAAITLTGDDIDGNGAKTGSQYSSAKMFTITLDDCDGDGMPDAWETAHGLLKCDPSDAALDPDSDGLTNLQEFTAGTDPQNPDTDGDGDNDGSEAHHGRNPVDPSDGKRITIQLVKSGSSVVLNWPAGKGDNGVIDGPYWVYRSATPTFTTSSVLPGMPLSVPPAPPITTYTDTPTGSPWFYWVSNTPLTDAPVVASVVPPAGSVSGGDPISVYGSNFVSGASVKIGGVSATSVQWKSANLITCVTPAGSAGAKDVTVTNPNGQFGTKTGGFTYD